VREDDPGGARRLVLEAYPHRPGRIGFSLHRTGRMIMLRGLRGRKVHARVPLRSFSHPAPQKAGECPTLSGLFVPESGVLWERGGSSLAIEALLVSSSPEGLRLARQLRSYRGMPPGEPVRVRRVLGGVGVEAVLESCFHSWRRRPGWGAGLTPAEVRILPPPRLYIPGQRRSGLSLHRTGMIAMIHGLRGRTHSHRMRH
jgi:hypothetical protein